jgi:nucleotide-binding universal stress UspA family protein
MTPEGSKVRYVVVGVTRQQPPIVVQWAARFARQVGAALVCAHVEAANYVVEEHPDGSVESRPIDPDVPDWDTAVFDSGLAARIGDLARDAGISVEFRELAGDIGHALARLAEVLEAEMIIVGSRRGAGLRSGMREFFGGSVAVHLAHRQPRPVVVIPLSPRSQGRLPWEHQP